MRIRHVGLLGLLLVLALLAAANWTTMMAPTEINLLVSRIEAPFGLIMLVTVGLMGCIYVLMLLITERRLMAVNARQAQELATLREEALEGQDTRIKVLETAVTGNFGELKTQLSRVLEQIGDLRSRSE